MWHNIIAERCFAECPVRLCALGIIVRRSLVVLLASTLKAGADRCSFLFVSPTQTAAIRIDHSVKFYEANRRRPGLRRAAREELWGCSAVRPHKSRKRCDYFSFTTASSEEPTCNKAGTHSVLLSSCLLRLLRSQIAYLTLSAHRYSFTRRTSDRRNARKRR